MSVNTLLARFRGLRAEDLDIMNPEYSCVLCKHLKRCNGSPMMGVEIGHGAMISRRCDSPGPGRSCGQHESMTESEFADVYDF